MRFVETWARFVREHPDKEWSRQQKDVIDPQFLSTMSKDVYLRMKQQ